MFLFVFAVLAAGAKAEMEIDPRAEPCPIAFENETYVGPDGKLCEHQLLEDSGRRKDLTDSTRTMVVHPAGRRSPEPVRQDAPNTINHDCRRQFKCLLNIGRLLPAAERGVLGTQFPCMASRRWPKRCQRGRKCQ